MRAWAVRRPGPIEGRPLPPRRPADPLPGPTRCASGVARAVCAAPTCISPKATSPPHRRARARPRGRRQVDALGADGARFAGDRVGIAWLRHSGAAGFAARARRTCATTAASPAGTPTAGTPSTPSCRAYAYGLRRYADRNAAPLLCAGIIGYRALAGNAAPGGRLGIYGFGASAHLAAQVAIAQGATVHVSPVAAASDLVLGLGAASAGHATIRLPSRSTRRSSSPRSASWCRRPLTRSTAAGPWRRRGSISPTYRRLDYAAHLFQERSCAAPPRTPARTAKKPSRSRPSTG